MSDTEHQERYAVLPGFSSYRISSLGFIETRRGRNGRGLYGWRRMRPSNNPKKGGYLIAAMVNDRGVLSSASVHRLILMAFVGSCPDGFQCAHLDGDDTNNRLDNLAWVSPKTNSAHRHIHGTAQVGERHVSAKLTTADVINIRTAARTGEAFSRIAKRLRLPVSASSNAAIGISWKHLNLVCPPVIARKSRMVL